MVLFCSSYICQDFTEFFFETQHFSSFTRVKRIHLKTNQKCNLSIYLSIYLSTLFGVCLSACSAKLCVTFLKSSFITSNIWSPGRNRLSLNAAPKIKISYLKHYEDAKKRENDKKCFKCVKKLRFWAILWELSQICVNICHGFFQCLGSN